MKRVVILHGWEGSPQGNWFPWLKQELEARGYQVTVPDFPDSATPKLSAWLKTLEQVIGQPDADLILVGHSLGSVTILRYLATINHPIKAAILVSPFTALRSDKDGSDIMTFLDGPWNWSYIRHATGKIFVIGSNNDPYIEQDNFEFIANSLKTKLVLKKSSGHFNLTTSPKFKKFPFLLEIIDQLE